MLLNTVYLPASKFKKNVACRDVALQMNESLKSFADLSRLQADVPRVVG